MLHLGWKEGAVGEGRQKKAHPESSNQSTPKGVYAGQHVGGGRGWGLHPLLCAGDWDDHLFVQV